MSTFEFDQLLSKLPFISLGERLVSCAIYSVVPENIRHQMIEFYAMLEKGYKDKLAKFEDSKKTAQTIFINKMNSLK